MIESPKTRFQLSKPDVEMLAKLVKQDDFLRAIDAALAQTVWDCQDANDAQTAMSGFWRITGARAFVRNFMTLANVAPLMPSAKLPSNLNHEIYDRHA